MAKETNKQTNNTWEREGGKKREKRKRRFLLLAFHVSAREEGVANNSCPPSVHVGENLAPFDGEKDERDVGDEHHHHRAPRSADMT